MTQSLSRLTAVPVREVWPHEARDFTPWLLENADVLSDLLGMELELSEAEHPVGGFSLDLIGRDLTTGEVVIVENQLEATDHSHLGQLLTYAGGTDPATIVWCAPEFREEHRAALDWLNEQTGADVRFFGVEVALVRIGDSPAAPAFRLVAKPNDWTKDIHAKSEAAVSARSAAYSEFWAKLFGIIRERHPEWTSSAGRSKLNWIALPYGVSGISYLFVFSQNGPRVELYFGDSDPELNTTRFEEFLSYRTELDALFGAPLTYDPLPGRLGSRVCVERPKRADIFEVDTHDELLNWFVTTTERFRSATQTIRGKIESESRHGR